MAKLPPDQTEQYIQRLLATSSSSVVKAAVDHAQQCGNSDLALRNLAVLASAARYLSQPQRLAVIEGPPVLDTSVAISGVKQEQAERLFDELFARYLEPSTRETLVSSLIDRSTYETVAAFGPGQHDDATRRYLRTYEREHGLNRAKLSLSVTRGPVSHCVDDLVDACHQSLRANPEAFPPERLVFSWDALPYEDSFRETLPPGAHRLRVLETFNHVVEVLDSPIARAQIDLPDVVRCLQGYVQEQPLWKFVLVRASGRYQERPHYAILALNEKANWQVAEVFTTGSKQGLETDLNYVLARWQRNVGSDLEQQINPRRAPSAGDSFGPF